MRNLCAIPVLVLASVAIARADSITLNSGVKLTGDVVAMDDQSVTFEMWQPGITIVRTIPRSDIAAGPSGPVVDRFQLNAEHHREDLSTPRPEESPAYAEAMQQITVEMTRADEVETAIQDRRAAYEAQVDDIRAWYANRIADLDAELIHTINPVTPGLLMAEEQSVLDDAQRQYHADIQQLDGELGGQR